MKPDADSRAALTEAPHVFKSRLAGWDTTGGRYRRARMERPDTYNAVALLDGAVVGMGGGDRRGGFVIADANGIRG